MKQLSQFFKKAWSYLLVRSRVRVPVDGMEISDAVVRYCRLHVADPAMTAVKLPPGAMRGGKIADRELFLASIRDMKAQVFGPKAGAVRRDVVVSLASVAPSVQLFSLPVAADRDIGEAINLNMRMVAPSDASQTASGWQILQRDQDTFRIDVMGMFVDRAAVVDVAEVLREAGFVVAAVESKGLSIARAFMDRGGEAWHAGVIIMVCVDDAGIDLTVIRNGTLHFEYATAWTEMADDKGQISDDAFKATLVRNVNQVLNFYRQHWGEATDRFAVAAGDLSGAVQGVLAEYFPEAAVMPAGSIDLQGIPDAAIASYGAALHHFGASYDDGVNLLGDEAGRIMRGEMSLAFLHFWRIVVATALGCLVIVAGTGDFLFARSERSYADVISASPDIAAATARANALQDSARTFDRSVAVFQAVEAAAAPKNVAMGDLEGVARANSVALSHVSLSQSGSVTLAGSASSEDSILAFKKALEASAFAKGVSLPLTAIRSGGGIFSFTMTLSLLPS